MLKKFLVSMLVMILCFLPMQTFADSEITNQSEDVSPKVAPTIIYELQNVRPAGVVELGSWISGPTATGSTGGSVSKTITASLGATVSGSVSVNKNAFTAAFGFSQTQTFSISSTCTANVPPGKTVTIKYRGKYQAYNADQVMYEVMPGVPKHEKSRSKITAYKPIDLVFTW